MESTVTELDPTEIVLDQRPSEEFIRAVSEFFETDPRDLLAELGYIPDEALVFASA